MGRFLCIWISMISVYSMADLLLGRVTDENGNGVPEVTVSVYDITTHCVTNSAVSNSTGQYEVGDLPEGVYYVLVYGESILMRYVGNLDHLDFS